MIYDEAEAGNLNHKSQKIVRQFRERAYSSNLGIG